MYTSTDWIQHLNIFSTRTYILVIFIFINCYDMMVKSDLIYETLIVLNYSFEYTRQNNIFGKHVLMKTQPLDFRIEI